MAEEQKDQSLPTEQTPSPEVPKNVQASIDEIKNNLRPLIFSIVAAFVAVAAIFIWKNGRDSRKQEASELLLQASSLEQLQKISGEFADTPSGAFALVAEGTAHFNAARYQEAMATFEKLKQGHPGHPASDIAEYLHAVSQEANGDLSAARAAYEAFASSRPTHYLTPSATFGKARCLAQEGNPQEAVTVYEDFIAANPDSPWKREAEYGASETKRKMRQMAAAASQPQPAQETTIPFALPQGN